MTLIRPFAGLRPTTTHVSNVLAPPYDVLSSAEARERAVGKPWSFLHISKPEIDLAENIDPYDPAVYAKGAENLENMLNNGILQQDKHDCYYIYQLTMGQHKLAGLVAGASVEAYNNNRIRRHEFTRPNKEDDRVKQIDALNAQTGPVLLAYRSEPIADQLLMTAAQGKPEYDVVAEDGIRHELWVVHDQQLIKQITQTFDSMDLLYIADGHHRSAAASRIAAQRSNNQAHHFLSVIFPHQKMQILDYNRIIKDLNGLSSQEFLQKVQEKFDFTPTPEAIKPSKPGEFAMYLQSQWYHLSIKSEYLTGDPVASLDVSLLANHLIEPILGISDPRRDTRIDFVGGIRGLSELQDRVDQGEAVVAFALFATSMEQLMAVADSGEVMPPKSTWFEPKLADGLVSYSLK